MDGTAPFGRKSAERGRGWTESSGPVECRWWWRDEVVVFSHWGRFTWPPFASHLLSTFYSALASTFLTASISFAPPERKLTQAHISLACSPSAIFSGLDIYSTWSSPDAPSPYSPPRIAMDHTFRFILEEPNGGPSKGQNNRKRARLVTACDNW